MPSTLLSDTGDPQKQVNCLVRGTYNLAEKKGKIRVQRTQPRPTLIPGRGEVASGKLAWKGTSAGLHHDKRGFPLGTGREQWVSSGRTGTAAALALGLRGVCIWPG